MKRWLKIAAGLTGLAGAGLLGRRHLRTGRAWHQVESALLEHRADGTFDPAVLDGLPAPAQHYLHHAIAESAPLARSVRIEMTGRMKPNPGAAYVDLTAEELLAPPVGFQWTARFSIGPLPVWVRDHYYHSDGSVRLEPLGLLIRQSTGSNITRSSRHRLAAESVWMPSSLLPGPGVAWTAIDDVQAQVTLTIDGEAIPLTLTIGEKGQLRHVTMERYGDVDGPGWRHIPYGFAVEEEATFGGYTIPVRLRGGWWFGTERYQRNQASTFNVRTAQFR